MAIPLFIAVSATALVVLVVLLVILVRRMVSLVEAVGRFQTELRPVVEDIRRETDRARQSASALSERRRQAQDEAAGRVAG